MMPRSGVIFDRVRTNAAAVSMGSIMLLSDPFSTVLLVQVGRPPVDVTLAQPAACVVTASKKHACWSPARPTPRRGPPPPWPQRRQTYGAPQDRRRSTRTD